MAKRQKDVCPGCSRHCPAGNVRCKYGKKHFEKNQRKGAALSACGSVEEAGRHRRKWEKHVQEGGLAWKLLWTAAQGKRALRRKELTEQELLAAFNEAEQAQLAGLLEKISKTLG